RLPYQALLALWERSRLGPPTPRTRSREPEPHRPPPIRPHTNPRPERMQLHSVPGRRQNPSPPRSTAEFFQAIALRAAATRLCPRLLAYRQRAPTADEHLRVQFGFPVRSTAYVFNEIL